MRGICDAGGNVMSIDLAGTEEMYWAVTEFNACAGLEITASHNPINSTDRRDRILRGLVSQVPEHSPHISQHQIPIHCKTVFLEFTEKLNSK